MRAEIAIAPPDSHPSCHASSICETASGDLLVCCFAGQYEGAPDQAILGASLRHGEAGWSKPTIWVDVVNRAAGNPRVFRAPDGDGLWLVAPINYGAWCSGGTRLFLKRSYDEGREWSDLELIDCPAGILGKNKPLIEQSLCILPVEYEVPWSACFLRTRDAGRSWEVCGNLGEEEGAHLIQPAIVRLQDRRLAAFMRSQEDWVFVSFSDDDGTSWSRPSVTPIPNNNSGIDVCLLRSGRLLLVCNPVASGDAPEKLDPAWPLAMPVSFDRWGQRTPLAVVVSEDGGVTWNQALRLEEGRGVYSYPAIMEGNDGAIHITYTHERTSIKHVELSEEELVAGIEFASEEVTP